MNATISNDSEIPPLLVEPKDAAKLCAISIRTLWRLVSSGDFVNPVRFGTRIVRFRIDDIRAWIESRIAESQH
jgi:predicted DNA-binding transcriptional regulator AlpA